MFSKFAPNVSKHQCMSFCITYSMILIIEKSRDCDFHFIFPVLKFISNHVIPMLENHVIPMLQNHVIPMLQNHASKIVIIYVYWINNC